jgi:hypothetical protein
MCCNKLHLMRHIKGGVKHTQVQRWSVDKNQSQFI